MSRVLLVGRGPLPTPEERSGGFAQLRTRHFLGALRGAGHAVRLVLLERGAPHGPTPEAWAAPVVVSDEGAGWLARAAALGRGADAVVSAGPDTPGLAAVAAAGDDTPLWLDVPGDPFAELEAVGLAGAPLDDARRAAAHAAIHPGLARADRFSAVSARQRLALVGQLGLLGRLDGVDRVADIPIADDLPLPRLPPRPRRAGEPLVVALAGAFNPWLDVDALVAGLDAALAAREGIRVVVTGGAVDGLPDAGWQRFLAWARGHADRVRVRGWVPHGALSEALGAAHVGVFLDRPDGREPELGDRTRVLLFAACGLDVVATDRSARVAGLASRGLVTGLPAGDPAALAAALLDLHDRDRDTDRTLALRAALAATSDPVRLAAPLVAWAAAPDRARPAPSPAATLAAERDRLRDQLAAVHGSPTWRVLSRLHRLVRR